MSYELTKQAFLETWTDQFAVLSDPTVCAYPNKNFTPPSQALWCRVHYMPSDKDSVTLGDTGQDEQTGFFQIDINIPKNKGDGDLQRTADTVVSYFRSGRSMVKSGVTVRVTKSSVSPAREVDDHYRVSVTIYYRTRTNRQPL